MSSTYTGTSTNVVINSFLNKIDDDVWSGFLYEEAHQDWIELLDAAISWFKFPRVSLAHDNENFEDDLSNEEVQILSQYMRCELLSRTVTSWNNIKPLYDERDFSQANMLAKLTDMLTQERSNALRLESLYYRSVKHKPFDYTRLTGFPDEGNN